MLRLCRCAGLALLLGGCAIAPDPIPPETPEATRRSAETPTPAISTPGGAVAPPAVSPVERLLADAQELREVGNLSACFARLERALRIAPQDARIYLELARTHLEAGHRARASASAERGLLYCRGSNCRELRRYIES